MPGFLGGGTSSTSASGNEISFSKEFIDPVTKLRISQPENLIDTDFEYGLQPTKWETLELINNTPSFFSKSGDTTIPGIVSITTNAGTREITVNTSLDHNLAVGIPIQVSGTKSITADGSFIINSIPNPTTFTYLCKDDQNDTASIEDLYSSIITGEFFQGSQIRVEDSAGVTTDGEPLSTLTVTTGSTHGFGINTPFYFLNINSTISQEFQASNTASKSFDSSNSTTAQTFDGSNSLSTINIDWSNSAVVGGLTSTVNSVSTTNNTITVAHGSENFSGKSLGTPIYYSVVAGIGYFAENPRGVVFINSTSGLGVSSSTFTVSGVPGGVDIPIESSMTGTMQLANQARIFAGNNINPTNQTEIAIEIGNTYGFEGANNGGLADPATQLTTATVSSYSAGLVTVTVSDVAKTLDFYTGAMVLYSSTGSAATGLTNNTTYFVDEFFATAPAGSYRMTLKPLPTSPALTSISGGTGTQTFTRIGVSLDKDIVHAKGSDFALNDMVEYAHPTSGNFGATEVKDYYFVDVKYDTHNYKLRSEWAPNGLSSTQAGVSAAQLKADWGYNTNGVYWIDLPGVGPTEVYCIMDSAVNGGGWMMMMKATRGATFNYDSGYWTGVNTLNSTAVNRNDGDAKFEVMNRFSAKDMLAIWPDIGQGGSLSLPGYNWIWLQNNFYGGTRIVPTTFFNTVGGAGPGGFNYGGKGYFIQDAKTFGGWAAGVFSSQVDIRFYGYNYLPYTQYASTARVRWGFGWNENAEGLYPGAVGGAPGSNDVSGGIGMGPGPWGSYSAGDAIACCQDTTGINRSARVEIYVR